MMTRVFHLGKQIALIDVDTSPAAVGDLFDLVGGSSCDLIFTAIDTARAIGVDIASIWISTDAKQSTFDVQNAAGTKSCPATVDLRRFAQVPNPAKAIETIVRQTARKLGVLVR